MSDPDTEGGELRAYPQSAEVDGKVGAYGDQNDLQIGWLREMKSDSSTALNSSTEMCFFRSFFNKFGFIAVRPVFLDCWIRSEGNFARSSLFVVGSLLIFFFFFQYIW